MDKVDLPVLGFFREKLDIEEFNFKNQGYQQAYHELLDMLSQQGIYVAVLMGQSTYLGDGKFSKHWYQVKKGDSFRFEKRGPIETDVVWVKDQFKAQDVPQINSSDFCKICSDKNLTYELLYDYQPQSHLVNSEEEFYQKVASLPGDKIVVKTLTGNSGLGVFVGNRTEFKAETFNNPFPWQLQEFVETAKGIPGIVESRHDFRVVTINGQPIIATLRTPPKDGLKSNIGYGGVTRLLSVDKIPQDLLPLVARIDKELSRISGDRFYSADFGLTDRGWLLFEVNAMPGTINRQRGEPAVFYQQQLASFLTQTATKYNRKEAK